MTLPDRARGRRFVALLSGVRRAYRPADRLLSSAIGFRSCEPGWLWLWGRSGPILFLLEKPRVAHCKHHAARRTPELEFTQRLPMPEKSTIQRARRDKREGKAPSTQAGEFVRQEIHHVRRGKHGVRSTKQAVAIGLSKARRAGVDLPPPRKGTTSEKTRKSAERSYKAGHSHNGKTSSKRSKATSRALKREGHRGASHKALSRQARSGARHRSRGKRVESARHAARTRHARASR